MHPHTRTHTLSLTLSLVTQPETQREEAEREGQGDVQQATSHIATQSQVGPEDQSVKEDGTSMEVDDDTSNLLSEQALLEVFLLTGIL